MERHQVEAVVEEHHPSQEEEEVEEHLPCQAKEGEAVHLPCRVGEEAAEHYPFLGEEAVGVQRQIPGEVEVVVRCCFLVTVGAVEEVEAK